MQWIPLRQLLRNNCKNPWKSRPIHQFSSKWIEIFWTHRCSPIIRHRRLLYPPLNTCLLHKISLQKTLKSRVTDSIWHPHPQTVSSLCGEQSQQWSPRRQTWHNNLKAQLQQSAPTNPSYHCNLQTCTHIQWCLCPVNPPPVLLHINVII